MDKKDKLKKLEAEKEYYNFEFIEKQIQNKKYFANKIFNNFIQEFDNLEYSVNRQNDKVEFISIDYKFIIRLLTEIEIKPRESLMFQIRKTEIKTQKSIEYLMHPNNISPLQNPDFNKLLDNPYKGMDQLDIEILELQKDIDFLKKYISETFDYNNYSFYCENLTVGKLFY